MRFLCLHGKGHNTSIFETQLSGIRKQLSGQHEFVFLQGGRECKPAPGAESLYSSGGPFYTYYNVPTTTQLPEAFKQLDDIIESKGPFDGIIGFSQGGELGASYLLQDAKKGQQRFKCAIFFSTGMPFDLDSRPFLVSPDKKTCYYADNTSEIIPNIDISSTIPETFSAGYATLEDTKTPIFRRYSKDYKDAHIDMPTTHIYASNDKMYCEQSRALRGLCDPDTLEHWEHVGGHDVPNDRNAIGMMVECIEDMLFHV